MTDAAHEKSKFTRDLLSHIASTKSIWTDGRSRKFSTIITLDESGSDAIPRISNDTRSPTVTAVKWIPAILK